MATFLDGMSQHWDTLGITLLLVTVLGVILRQLATGQIIFRKQYEELRADKDAELARATAYYHELMAFKDEQIAVWHDSYKVEASGRASQGATLEELLSLARASEHMLRALPTSQAYPGGHS